MNAKRGSSAVFLMMILGALVSITLMLIYGVRQAGVGSRVDAVASLAGDSVMSEFDREIQREYGLFLLKGTDAELSGKLRKYIKYSTDDMGDVTLEKAKASGSRFSALNTDLIKEQILEYMKTEGAEDSLNKEGGAADEGGSGTNERKRTLRHGPTIVSLPSAQLPDRSLTAMAETIIENAGKIDEVFKKGAAKYTLDEYILQKFNNEAGLTEPEHFFCAEAEYILGGKMSDESNNRLVGMALTAIRFPLNLTYIYTDTEKNAETLAAAELITPGPAAQATQALLASAWAYAETDNDVELLRQGHRVPMLKDELTWAIDLNDVTEGISGKTVTPTEEKGYDYEDYLHILLFFQNESLKISRVLDLIQINTRAGYDGDFLISEYSAGINIEVKVNGRTYGYDKKY